MTAKAGRWAVQCAGHTTPATTREAAERLSAQVEAAGHCMFQHRVVEAMRCDSCDVAGFPRFSAEHSAYFCDECHKRENAKAAS